MGPHWVSFRGPPLSRQLRAALSAGDIRVLQRWAIPAWCGQLQDFLVALAAHSREDAIARVERVVMDHGRYELFAAAAELR